MIPLEGNVSIYMRLLLEGEIVRNPSVSINKKDE